jgi:hypothetical protein
MGKTWDNEKNTNKNLFEKLHGNRLLGGMRHI